MPGLTKTGTFSYNGYEFDGTAKMRVSSKPEYDEAGRTVVCVNIIIDVEAVVSVAGTTSDDAMQDIRERLSHAGQKLVLQNKGFSRPLTVNGGGAVKDVRFGPLPEVLEWSPIGNSRSCAIKWRVSTCVSACGTAGRHDGVMAMNYEANYSIDARGATTRTLSGYIEIAMTRTKDMRLPDSADDYRKTFAPPAPRGFRRTTRTFQIDKSKRRCNFTLVDTEWATPNAPPAGVVNISGDYDVSWEALSGWRRANLTLEVERDSSLSGGQTWVMFNALVLQKIRAAQTAGKYVFIDRMSVKESLFGYTSHFSCGFRFTSQLDDLVAAGGLWQPLGGDWDIWRASLEGSMFNDRGTAGLRTSANNDAIIDLCGASSIPMSGSANELSPDSSFGALLQNQTPPVNQSWISYMACLIPAYQGTVAMQNILQSPGVDNQRELSNSSTGNFRPQPAGRTPAVIQQGSGGQYRVFFTGTAERAGYPIPRPRLAQLGGQKAVEISGTYYCREKCRAMGLTVYEAGWNILYALASAPKEVIPVPKLNDIVK